MLFRPAYRLPVCLLPLLSAVVLGLAMVQPGPARAALPADHLLESDALQVIIETGGHDHEAEFGPRFDRTAVVRSIRLNGRELLSRWGLCDEFGLFGDGVLGYKAAQPGESFLKIGFGRLAKLNDSDYRFNGPYPVEERLPFTSAKGKDFVEIEQVVDNGADWGYHYRKRYTVEPGNVLRIDYTLSNRGRLPWSFEHYNHHWFLVEGAPPGPGYILSTKFSLPDAEGGFQRQSHSLQLPSALLPGRPAYLAGELSTVPASDNRFQLTVNGQLSISYHGDFSPARFAAFADARGFCPELFFRANLAPGETAHWSARYRFTVP